MKQWFLPVVLMLTACQQTQKVQQISEPAVVPDTTARDTSLPQQAWTAPPPVAPEDWRERDTVTIGDVLYTVTDIDPAEFRAVPAYQPHPETEDENILPYAGKVSRRGDSLLLKLEDGRTEVLTTSHSDGDDAADYRFLDYIPALKAYLVYVVGYEYYHCMLVHAATGAKINTVSIPQLSPDKRSFICSNSDLVAGFTTNGFELFRVSGDNIMLAQERQPESWGPVMIKWKDAKSFVAHLQERDAQMNETDRFVMLVPR
jgi:hypothetical protein